MVRSNRLVTILLLLVLLPALIGVVPKTAIANDDGLELVAEISGPGTTRPWFIEAIRGLNQTPHRLLLAVQNQGASCGSGTPSSIWEVTLDPVTNQLQSLEHKQFLSKIQSVRRTLFESSNGALFTGGGWCGYKPAYYSVDRGNTWKTADSGSVYPPDSVFGFAELNGQVYAGTGYNERRAELYHWLGNGRWEHVFRSPPGPRTILQSMKTHQGVLFIAPQIYGGDPDESSVAIYRSTDGQTFTPTAGIPFDFSVWEFLTVGNDLLAFGWANRSNTEIAMYHWNAGRQIWELVTQYAGKMEWKISGRNIMALDNALYGFGHAPGDERWGIYRSDDWGVTWQQILPFTEPEISYMTAYEGSIYFGTFGDAAGKAYLYRLTPEPDTPHGLANPGFESGVWGWTFYTNGAGVLSNDSPGYEGVASGRIDIDAPGSNVQLYQAGFTLEPRTRYRLQFAAKSSTGHDLAVYLQQDSNPYSNYGVRNFRVNLTSVWKVFTIEFTTKGFNASTTDTRLRFWLAPFDAVGDVYWFDQVSLQKVTSPTVTAAATATGSIVGRVQGVGAPVAVTLVALNDEESIFQSVMTDEAGAFVFANVPAGAYELQLTPPAGYLVPEPIQLLVGEEPNEEMMITLEPLAEAIFLPLIAR